jgi:hypothetical protein
LIVWVFEEFAGARGSGCQVLVTGLIVWMLTADLFDFSDWNDFLKQFDVWKAWIFEAFAGLYFVTRTCFGFVLRTSYLITLTCFGFAHSYFAPGNSYFLPRNSYLLWVRTLYLITRTCL